MSLVNQLQNICSSQMEIFNPDSTTLPFKPGIRLKLSELNKIPDLNRGGCAIVAYALVQYINKAYPELHPEIVFLCNINQGPAWRNLINNRADSSSHVVVKIDNMYYDSTGVYTKSEIRAKWKTAETAIASQELTLRSIHTNEWNPAFNRKKYVSTIGHILDMKTQLIKDIS